MKKLLSLMLIAFAAVMLSSCIIVATNDEPPRYEIACYNNTYAMITDWCVKKGSDITYANSKYNCEIEPGKTDIISGLSSGYYSICITFNHRSQLHPDDYQQTNEIYLDRNVTFKVAERQYYGRSAVNTDDENTEKQYVIVFSDGKEYPLN